MSWKAITIISIWLCALAGYAFRDGSDPWLAAAIATVTVLLLWS